MSLPADLRGIVTCLRSAADARAAVARQAATLRGFAERGRCRVLALGKAAAAMVGGLREAGIRPSPGSVAVVPKGYPAPAGVRTIRGAHPVPDGSSARAGAAVERFLHEVARDGRPLMVLLSGGASACVAAPIGGLLLQDLAALTSALLHSGLPIDAVNTVRRHTDRLKGGKAALLLPRVKVACLAVSDVPGGKLEAIASGPFVPDPTTPAHAARIVRRLPVFPGKKRVLTALGARPKPARSFRFAHVWRRIVLDNRAVLKALRTQLAEAGRLGKILPARAPLAGEASNAGRDFARRAARLAAPRRRCVLIAGGETTVTIPARSRGHGGRNQEFALAAALELARLRPQSRITILSFATDGVDGVAPPGRRAAAGAWVDCDTVGLAAAAGVDAAACLRRHDARGFFDRARRGLIVTGATGANVNDVAVAIVGSLTSVGRAAATKR